MRTGDGAWWVASTHSTRSYLATVGPDTNRHLLLVAVVGTRWTMGRTSRPTLRFENAVAPILESLAVSRMTFTEIGHRVPTLISYSSVVLAN